MDSYVRSQLWNSSEQTKRLQNALLPSTASRWREEQCLTMSVFLQGQLLFLNRQQIILEVFGALGEENVVLFVFKMEMNNIVWSTFPQQKLWENISIHAALHWLIHGHDLTFMFSSLTQQTNVKSLFFLSFFSFKYHIYSSIYSQYLWPTKAKRDQ